MNAIQEVKLPRAVFPRHSQGLTKECLADYAESLALQHVQTTDPEQRKAKGQFFTPKEVARFMASLFHIKGQNISLIDPGAGVGILTAAFCERILPFKEKRVSIDAYENDPSLLPSLKRVLEECKSVLEEAGHQVSINLQERDFILDNAQFFDKERFSFWQTEQPTFGYVVSNPPYYKLNAASPHARAMKELELGHPNVYAFFMALSLRLLKHDGEMVFIIPRSFCSGFYYKKFRSWLLDNASLVHIHSFESRREVFEHEGVLQENIILKAVPKQGKFQVGKVKITVSKNHGFEDMKGHEVPSEDIVHKMRDDALIKIPTTKLHVTIQHAIEDWKYTLHDLGLEVSTGPVVDFRAKELLVDFINERVTAPLIWMHNIQDMQVIWPARKNGKQTGIRLTRDSDPLLLPVRNYVLIKRFSSKEQERRLYAGALLEKDFDMGSIGIENHVNYLYRKQGNLTPDETIGIAALLNTSLVDEYFRCLNGNTQVNASDLRVLPFPSLNVIKKVGKVVAVKKLAIGVELDKVVAEVLGISDKIIRSLSGQAT